MITNKVVIYTDGGCAPNPGLGGWSAVLMAPDHDNKQKEIWGSVPDTTNNRMELTAAIKALESLKRPCQVSLFTDSQYIKKAFTDGWLANWIKRGWITSSKKPVANKDLWIILAELDKKHHVDWQWVKGHANNPYNERCDQLVAQARQEYKQIQ